MAPVSIVWPRPVIQSVLNQLKRKTVKMTQAKIDLVNQAVSDLQYRRIRDTMVAHLYGGLVKLEAWDDNKFNRAVISAQAVYQHVGGQMSLSNIYKRLKPIRAIWHKGSHRLDRQTCDQMANMARFQLQAIGLREAVSVPKTPELAQKLLDLADWSALKSTSKTA